MTFCYVQIQVRYKLCLFIGVLTGYKILQKPICNAF